METLNIIVCYEKDRGGETDAFEAICSQLKKIKNVNEYIYSNNPLLKTDFLSFFLWNLTSITYWISIIYPLRNKIDWVYTPTYTAAVAASVIKLFSSYNICWHFHGERIPPLIELHGIHKFSHRLKRSAVIFLHKLFLRATSLVIVPGNSKHVSSLETLGVHLEIIHTIPNGVDHKKFYPVSKERKRMLRSKYNLPTDAKVLLVTGRLEPLKNIKRAIEVAIYLKKTIRNIYLVILFPTPSTQSETEYHIFLQNFVKKKEAQSYILFIQNNPNFQEGYQMADVTISLSLKEYFPITLLESAASERIYMASKESGVSDVLTTIDPRLVFHSGDIERITKQIQGVLFLPVSEFLSIEKKMYKYGIRYSWKNAATSLYKAFIQRGESL